MIEFVYFAVSKKYQKLNVSLTANKQNQCKALALNLIDAIQLFLSSLI
jgi:hypothetical protein